MKKILSFLWEVVRTTLIALIVVVPIRYFLFQPFIVRGESMQPNFYQNDYLIVDEISYRILEPKRGEVIVFKYPKDISQRYIKRIIGLPGETVRIEDNKIFIENFSGSDSVEILDESSYLVNSYTTGNIQLSLEENEYFVLGDNRFFSSDSRTWGTVPGENIIGKVFFRGWPLESFERIISPVYK